MAKKTLLMLIVVCTICIGNFAYAAGSDSAESKLTKVRLNEVVHSIFYAPQYVALELGFFEDEGLDITLSVGNGADKTMTALIAKEADIGLLGTEAGLYVYAEGRENFAISFAQLNTLLCVI